jgi:predicted nuclease of predicted toxin-antitoxin system
MRLLIDESIPVRLRRYLPDHAVKTVVEMGWSGMRNGALLTRASRQFNAFITVDKNLPFQQNLQQLPIAVIVLEAHSNELGVLVSFVPNLLQALLSLAPGTLVRVAA